MKAGLFVAGGFVVAVVALLAWVMVQTAITGENPLAGRNGPGREARAWVLDAGDCFDEGPDFDASVHVEVVDCADPHDSEIVRVESFSTYGSEGDDAVDEALDEAEDECREPFAAYVDTLAEGSGVRLRMYLSDGDPPLRGNPLDETRWEVACVAWSADGRFGG